MDVPTAWMHPTIESVFCYVLCFAIVWYIRQFYISMSLLILQIFPHNQHHPKGKGKVKRKIIHKERLYMYRKIEKGTIQSLYHVTFLSKKRLYHVT
jgi:hypothetical protein